MSDPLPERLARAAMENAVQMKGLEASVALAIRTALDEAVAVARRYAVASAHMNTNWHDGAAAIECAARIAVTIEALKT